MKRLAFYIPDIEKIGIYMIENITTKHRYIGSAVNLKNRLMQHEKCIRLGYSINKKIDADIDAGHAGFFVSILAVFEDGTITERELSMIEGEYIRSYGTNNEYNYPGRTRRNRLKPNQLLYSKGVLTKAAIQ